MKFAQLLRLALAPAFFLGLNLSVLAEDWSLKEVLNYAKKHGPEIKESEARVALAQAKLAEARSAYFPRLQLRSGYSQTTAPMYSFGNILSERTFAPDIDFNDVPKTDNFNSSIVASISLYNGGRDAAGVAAAHSMVKGIKYGQSVSDFDYLTQVALTFISVQRAKEVVRSMTSAVKAFEASERAVKGRLKAGSALRTELLDIQVQLENARELLVRANNGEGLALEGLRSLLSFDGDQFTVAADTLVITEPKNESIPTERAELQAVAARRSAADSQVKIAKGGWLPRLSAQGAFDYNKGWKRDGDGQSYTIGVVADWDLFDGARTASRVAQAEAELNEITQSETRIRNSIILGVRSAQIKLREAKEAVVITDKALRLAAESAELTRLRFSQGLSAATQLIDAEHALTNASVRRSEAEMDRVVAVILFRRAMNMPPIDEDGE